MWRPDQAHDRDTRHGADRFIEALLHLDERRLFAAARAVNQQHGVTRVGIEIERRQLGRRRPARVELEPERQRRQNAGAPGEASKPLAARCRHGRWSVTLPTARQTVGRGHKGKLQNDLAAVARDQAELAERHQ